MDASRLKQEVPTRKDGGYERLAKLLKAEASKKLLYESPISYSSATAKSKAIYRKIMQCIEKTKSTIEEFATFVFLNDWSWMREGVPNLGYLGSDQFLDTFKWYVSNKQELTRSKEVLDYYNNTFKASLNDIASQRLALKIHHFLKKHFASVSSFFSYIKSINWRNGRPSLTYLASDTFLNQFYVSGGYLQVRRNGATYLSRILERLKTYAVGNSECNFEDFNWEIAELILKPLSSSSIPKKYQPLLNKLLTLLSNTESPSLGKYVVTPQGRLTPLGVFWIALAAFNVENFYVGSWRQELCKYIHQDVNSSYILEVRHVSRRTWVDSTRVSGVGVKDQK